MENIISESVREIMDLMSVEYKQNIILYGENGILDSIMLVQLIANIEEKILLQTNNSITLVNDKTFSLKNSPFKNENNIVKFIEEILKNE